MFAAGDRDGLIARLTPSFPELQRSVDLAMITFVTAEGVALGRVHTPQVFGDSMLARRSNVATVLKTGKATAGLEPGREVLGIFATAPVVADGRTIGAVDVGSAMTKAYLERLKTSLAADIAIHVEKGGKFEGQGSTFKTQPVLTDGELSGIAEGKNILRQVSHDGHSYVVGGSILRDPAGARLAVMEVASDVTAIVAARSAALWAIAASTLLACALVLAGFFLFARSIARSITSLTGVMGKLAAGDLTQDVPGQARSDETGAMARAVQVFKEAAIEKRRIEAAAAAAQAATEAAEQRSRAERDAAAEAAQVAVTGLAAGLTRLANGDLTVRPGRTICAGIRDAADGLQRRRNATAIDHGRDRDECRRATLRHRRDYAGGGRPIPPDGTASRKLGTNGSGLGPDYRHSAQNRGGRQGGARHGGHRQGGCRA